MVLNHFQMCRNLSVGTAAVAKLLLWDSVSFAKVLVLCKVHVLNIAKIKNKQKNPPAYATQISWYPAIGAGFVPVLAPVDSKNETFQLQINVFLPELVMNEPFLWLPPRKFSADENGKEWVRIWWSSNPHTKHPERIAGREFMCPRENVFLYLSYGCGHASHGDVLKKLKRRRRWFVVEMGGGGGPLFLG